MANTVAKVAVAGWIAVTLGGTARPGSAQGADPALTLHVMNHANIPAGDLARAVREGTQIYQHIGIRSIWTEVTAAVADGSVHLTVVLLSRETEQRKTTAEGIASNVLGTAVTPAGRAYIFCDRIEGLAIKKVLDPGRLLGKVIAHEVGHLLLPLNGHSRDGIMRADLNIAMRAGLKMQASAQRFTSAQGDLIRARLAATTASK